MYFATKGTVACSSQTIGAMIAFTAEYVVRALSTVLKNDSPFTRFAMPPPAAKALPTQIPKVAEAPRSGRVYMLKAVVPNAIPVFHASLKAFLANPLLSPSFTLSSKLIAAHQIDCSRILCLKPQELFLRLCSRTFSCILDRI